MITFVQYIGIHADSPDLNAQRRANAVGLIEAVNGALAELRAAGLRPAINPKTKCHIAGETLGGFRPQDSPVGAPGSSHKEGQGVDLFDPFGALGAFFMAHEDILVRHGLYMENTLATPTWCHLQTRKTRSGRRIFNP